MAIGRVFALRLGIFVAAQCAFLAQSAGPDARVSSHCAQAEGTGNQEAVSILDMPDIQLASTGRFPYAVSLRRAGARDHVCSGVLAGPRHVITAAHCVDGSPYSAGKRPIVFIGGVSVTNGLASQVYVASGTVIHPEWEASNKDQRSPNDISIVSLPEASNLTAPQLLFDHFQLRSGHKLVALGWGTGAGGPRLGEEIFGSLKMEPHEYIEDHHCNRSTLWNGEVQEGTCCGLNNDRSASCMVDSGSVLALLDSPGYDINSGTPSLDFIVGINTDGAPCGMAAKPDIFVPLSRHRQWIAEVMELNAQKK